MPASLWLTPGGTATLLPPTEPSGKGTRGSPSTRRGRRGKSVPRSGRVSGKNSQLFSSGPRRGETWVSGAGPRWSGPSESLGGPGEERGPGEDREGSPNSRGLLPGGRGTLAPETPGRCPREVAPGSSAESGLSGLGEGVSKQVGASGRTGSSTSADLRTPDSIPTAHLLPPQPPAPHLSPRQQLPPPAGWQDAGQRPRRRGVTGARPPRPPLRKSAPVPSRGKWVVGASGGANGFAAPALPHPPSRWEAVGATRESLGQCRRAPQARGHPSVNDSPASPGACPRLSTWSSLGPLACALGARTRSALSAQPPDPGAWVVDLGHLGDFTRRRKTLGGGPSGTRRGSARAGLAPGRSRRDRLSAPLGNGRCSQRTDGRTQRTDGRTQA